MEPGAPITPHDENRVNFDERQTRDHVLGRDTLRAQRVEDTCRFVELRVRRLVIAARQQRAGLADQRHATVGLRLRRQQFLRQAVVIAHGHVRELAHGLEPAGGLELGVEILDQEADQLLGVRTRLLRLLVRRLGTVPVDPAEDRADQRDEHQARGDHGESARLVQRAPGLGRPFLLRGQLPLGLVARLALVSQVAARAHHAAQDVVRELDAAHVEAFLDAQQSTIDELGERVGFGARRCQGLRNALLGEALAIAGFRQQLVFDDAPHTGRLVDQRALVELRQDRVARAGQQVGRDLAPCPAPAARC